MLSFPHLFRSQVHTLSPSLHRIVLSSTVPHEAWSISADFLPAMVLHQNGGSSTCVVEPSVELQDVSAYLQKPHDAKTAPSLKISDRRSLNDDPVETLPSPTTQAAEKLERWNQSSTNVYRTFAAFWSFVVMGSNDAAYGALIPYVSTVCSVTKSQLTVASCKSTTT